MSYIEVVASLPVPTREQTDRFGDHVANNHSWYKHLPFFPPGASFVFFPKVLGGVVQFPLVVFPRCVLLMLGHSLPPVRPDGSAAEHFVILDFFASLGVSIGERVGHADTVQRHLSDAVDRSWSW